jgi:HK97 family phage major capsid protein
MPDIVIPASAEELEEMLNDGDRMAPVLADPQVHAEFTRAYAKAALTQNNADQAKQTKELLQMGMAEFLTANKGGDRPSADEVTRAQRLAAATAPQAMKNKLYNPRALGASLDKEPWAQSPGAFLKAVLATKTENSDDVKAFKASIKNAMSERVPSSGGFLVPETLRSQILMVALETAVVRSRARVIPMDSLRVPYPTIDDTSHTSSVYGGVVASWTEEGAQLSASQPSFGRIVLEAKKLTAYTEIPNELMEDAIAALDQWFNEMFPMAIAWFEDVAFIAGSGTGQPQGFINSPCAVVTGGNAGARAGGAGAAIQFSDIAAMYTRMLPASLNTAVWLCSPDVIGALLQMVITNANGTTNTAASPPLWLQAMQAHDGPMYTLLGRPLIVSEKMPAMANASSLAFVDFGYYLLGDRQSMQIANSEEYKFQNDLTAFRVIERLDGRTWIQSALTPENGGPTLSPVVLLHA